MADVQAPSIAERLAATRHVWAFPAGLCLLLTGLFAVGGAGHSSGFFEALAFERDAVAAGQWWRLWSGHLLHWNLAHLLLNLAALALWVPLCGQRWPAVYWLGSLAWLGLVVGGGMLVTYPETLRYAGFSGVMHGLFVLGLLPLVRGGDRLALLALGYLVVKVGWEQWSGVGVSQGVDIGARVATEAHLLGTLGALAQVLVQYVARRLWARRA